MLYLLLFIPALTAVFCFLPMGPRWWERFNIIGSLLTGAAAIYISLRALQAGGSMWHGSLLMVDELSAVLVFIIGVVGTI
ncbi:MAG: hydrogenase 4 subunit F, partial [Desulfocucumaceae bacterium]